METAIEAYDFTLGLLEELKEQGIKVTMVPSRSRENASTVEKYGKVEGGIPAHLWYHTTLHYEDAGQREKIFNATRYLGIAGISFDTGGCCNQYDWELDWSFRFKKGEEDWEKMEAQDWLHDILGKMDNLKND